MVFKLNQFPSYNSSANSDDMVAMVAELTQATFSLLLQFCTAPDPISPAVLANSNPNHLYLATLTCGQPTSEASQTSHHTQDPTTGICSHRGQAGHLHSCLQELIEVLPKFARGLGQVLRGAT